MSSAELIRINLSLVVITSHRVSAIFTNVASKNIATLMQTVSRLHVAFRRKKRCRNFVSDRDNFSHEIPLTLATQTACKRRVWKGLHSLECSAFSGRSSGPGLQKRTFWKYEM